MKGYIFIRQHEKSETFLEIGKKNVSPKVLVAFFYKHLTIKSYDEVSGT